MSAVAYVFVNETDLAKIAGRLEPHAGEMSKNDRGDFQNDDRGYIVAKSVALDEWPSIVKVHDGDCDERKKNAMRIFDLLKKHGDVAIEANFDFEETLATFDPKQDE